MIDCTELIELNSALIVIDMQNDFVRKDGALSVPGGERIIPPIKKLVREASKQNILIVFTQDWHEENDIEFTRDKWPKHCVKGTEGAKIVEELDSLEIERKIIRACEYDKFKDSALESVLRGNGVKRVFFAGLATEYCVKNTALSALELGFEVLVIADAISPVNESEGNKALRELKEKGARIISSAQALNELNK